MAVARLLDAAEREMDLGADGGAVDISDADLEVSHGAKRSRDISGVNGTGKAIRGSVEDFDRLFEALDLEDRQDRTENFLLRDPHRSGDLIEHRRAIEIAVDPSPLFVDRSSGKKPGPFIFPDLDITVHLLARGFVDQRPHLHGLVEAVSDPYLLSPLDQHLGELFFYISMEDQTARGGAPLSRGSECPPQGAFQSEIQISILHDDLRILPAHLQRNSF